MMSRSDWKRLLVALLAAGAMMPAPAWAQDEEVAEEEVAEDEVAEDEVAVEDDTDLDKDAAESGEDIDKKDAPMAEEDQDRLFKQPMSPPDGASAAFKAQLEQFQSGFARYAEEIRDYQATVDSIVDAEYKRKVAKINSFYDSKIRANESIEREYRTDALVAFEQFLQKYPREERYTPDAMFRLAELYFEKSNDDFLLADEGFQTQMALYEAGKLADPPAEPIRDYSPTIGTFRRLIAEWPEYRLLDGAYYLLAYAELQMGNEQEARDLFAQLIVKRPESEFIPEAWIRIGEYHFDYNELDLARAAYQQSMQYPESKYYDKALYKLAWTYYRQDNFHEAILGFRQLIEYSDEMERRTGQSGSVLREEAVQYMAISLAEEDWDLDGAKDDDFGLVRVREYVSGDKPYEREVLSQLGEFLFDNARYQDAIDMYNFTLKKYPLDRRNPEIHERVILAFLRDDNLDAAFKERSKLSQYYGEGSDWWTYQQKVGNAEAVRYAANLVKDNLIQSATWYHAEAQKLRERGDVDATPEVLAAAREKYGIAAKGYSDFLQKYPNDKDFYQWNFYYAECLYYSEQYEPAYQQYKVVREMDVANNEFQEIAGFNAIKSLELKITGLVERGELDASVLPRGALESARAAAESQEQAREDVDDRGDQKVVVQAQTIPPIVMDWVTSMDRYVVLGLKNEEDKYLDAKFAFQAGKIFYDFKDFPTARTRFNWIVANYPENEIAYLAGSLILETYREENDFQGLAAAAEKLGSVIKGEQAAAIQAEVRTLQLGALFKDAEQKFAEGKYEEAAAKYVELLQENPETEFAAKALNNAAVAYENVKRYESAMRLYERVYKEHPDDPLSTYALYRVGVNQERFFDFESAVQTYELFYDQAGRRTQQEINATGLEFELPEKRAQALLSAAVLQENLQRYERAAQGYERFVQEFPTDKQAAMAQWQAALVWEKALQKPRMVSAVEKFNRDFGGDPEFDARVMEGMSKIADYHKERGDKRAAFRQYESMVDEFVRRGIAPGSDAAFYGAKAQFNLVERDYQEWEGLKIKGNLNAQKKLLQEKIAGQKELTAKYEEIYAYQSLEWTLAASYRVAKMYQEFAKSLYDVPIPFNEDSEEYEIYRTQLEDLAIPLEDEAIRRYEASIAKAREAKVVNEWTKRTLDELNKYKPAEFPLYHEERRATATRRVTGSDYLDVEEYQESLRPPEVKEKK